MIYILTIVCMVLGYCVSFVPDMVWLVFLIVVVGNVIGVYCQSYHSFVLRSNTNAFILLAKADEALREASEKLKDDKELLVKVQAIISEMEEGEIDA